MLESNKKVNKTARGVKKAAKRLQMGGWSPSKAGVGENEQKSWSGL